MEYKLVILVRQDLKLPKGKLAVQAAHAAVETTLISMKKHQEKVKEWRHHGQKKIVLKVKNEKELFEFTQMAKDAGITTAVITDAGRTVIAPGTITCVGIGPDEDGIIDAITSGLGMM